MKFRRLNRNDWLYFGRTCAWSLLVCEGINLVVLLACVLFGWLTSGLFGWFILAFAWVVTTACQVGVISSIVTGLARRGVLENGRSEDLNEATGTYALNVVICLALIGLGEMVFGFLTGDVSNLGSTLIACVALAFIGSLVLSPLIIPAIAASQRFMITTAHRYRRVGA